MLCYVATRLHVPHVQDSGDYSLTWDMSIAQRQQPREMADCVGFCMSPECLNHHRH